MKDNKTTIGFSVSPDLKKRMLEFCDKQALNFSKKSCQLWEEFLNLQQQQAAKKKKGAA